MKEGRKDKPPLADPDGGYLIDLRRLVDYARRETDKAMAREIEMMLYRVMSEDDRCDSGAFRLIRSISSGDDASPYRLAPGRQTDFIKIVYAMYEDHMFVTENGLFASNKQKVMEAFGRLLHVDLSSYSGLLSKAKATTVGGFTDIFDKLKRHLRSYYDKAAGNG